MDHNHWLSYLQLHKNLLCKHTLYFYIFFISRVLKNKITILHQLMKMQNFDSYSFFFWQLVNHNYVMSTPPPKCKQIQYCHTFFNILWSSMDSTFLVIVLFEISVDMKLWREQTTNKAHLHRRFQQGIFAKRHNFRVKLLYINCHQAVKELWSVSYYRCNKISWPNTGRFFVIS